MNTQKSKLQEFDRMLKDLLSSCRNNGERLSLLNTLRQELIEEQAQAWGIDLETSKGQDKAFALAYRKNPELFSNSLMDRQ